MLSFDECKAIADNRAQEYGAEIAKAYSIGNDFAFDTDEQFIGVFPLVVESKTGKACGMWEYLVKHNLTMDDMQECDVA